ncbi:MAG: RNA polymerase subunit sigma-70, partial [Ahniella sp.]|nr:RNA polymerase subunit sigma-70 [Ahniella sp.]
MTGLLSRWRAGDREAERLLVERFYPVLKDIARQRLSRTPGHVTLRATDLVHEAYARLASLHSVEWKDRSHFLALTANIIRNLVIDHVRSRHAQKRGG